MSFLKYLALEALKIIGQELIKWFKKLRRDREIKNKNDAKAESVRELSDRLSLLYKQPKSKERDDAIKDLESKLEIALQRQHDSFIN